MEEMFKVYKDHDEIPGFYDILHIIFNDKCIEIMEYEYDPSNIICFKDIVQIAKDNGYLGGTIRLIAESPLRGEIFLYGNYHEEDEYGRQDLSKPIWYKQGETVGYV